MTIVTTKAPLYANAIYAAILTDEADRRDEDSRSQEQIEGRPNAYQRAIAHARTLEAAE